MTLGPAAKSSNMAADGRRRELVAAFVKAKCVASTEKKWPREVCAGDVFREALARVKSSASGDILF